MVGFVSLDIHRKMITAKVDSAKKELSEKRQLECSRLQLRNKIKRRIALNTLATVLDVSCS